MKKMLALALMVATPAMADEPFAGAYIGAHAGYNVGSSEGSFKGFSGGVQGGYNYALGNGLIAGIEADAALSEASVTGTDGDIAFKYSQDWQITTRARLGYQIGNIMPYATAGIAWGKFKARETDGETVATASETARLWVVGGGIDYRVPSTNVIVTTGVFQTFDNSISDGVLQFRGGLNLKLN